MDYCKRKIEDTIKKAVKQSKVVLITGARQVGKSTTLRNIFSGLEYVTLDDENELNLALTEKGLFFRDRTFPLIIDEVQYAGGLFRQIKLVADKSEKKGQIILTGSQTYELLSNASESLAGRISILEMPPLSMREIKGAENSEPFLPTDVYLKKYAGKAAAYDNLWETIHRGFMPELLDMERDREWFYRDYIRTYIERDIRQIINIQNENKFRNFLVSLAARSGSILVYSDIASDIGADVKTVQSWVSALEASGLVKLLHPYSNNLIKRTIKAPKIYFMDTGLLCYLAGWPSVKSAQFGAMSGNIFETYVVSEILKSRLNCGCSNGGIYFYRDTDKREIDLLIDDGDTLYPVEIKKGAVPDKSWARSFGVLNKIADRKVAGGVVICRAERLMPITENVVAAPVECL